MFLLSGRSDIRFFDILQAGVFFFSSTLFLPHEHIKNAVVIKHKVMIVCFMIFVLKRVLIVVVKFKESLLKPIVVFLGVKQEEITYKSFYP